MSNNFNVSKLGQVKSEFFRGNAEKLSVGFRQISPLVILRLPQFRDFRFFGPGNISIPHRTKLAQPVNARHTRINHQEKHNHEKS